MDTRTQPANSDFASPGGVLWGDWHPHSSVAFALRVGFGDGALVASETVRPDDHLPAQPGYSGCEAFWRVGRYAAATACEAVD